MKYGRRDTNENKKRDCTFPPSTRQPVQGSVATTDNGHSAEQETPPIGIIIIIIIIIIGRWQQRGPSCQPRLRLRLRFGKLISRYTTPHKLSKLFKLFNTKPKQEPTYLPTSYLPERPLRQVFSASSLEANTQLFSIAPWSTSTLNTCDAAGINNPPTFTQRQ